MEGKFITLEGIDGVGKSTQMACIGRLLKDAGIDYVATREPGGTPLAEEIRRLLLEVRDESVAGLAELLLVFAARSQHLEERIRPALDAGRLGGQRALHRRHLRLPRPGAGLE